MWQSDFGSSPVVSSALVADFNGDNVRDVLAGMEDAYRNDRGTHQLIKQLMALSHLPADKIERRFCRLQQQATVRPLQDFCSYIEENQSDLPATDLERIPGSGQDQQRLRGLAQWLEPARQRTISASVVHPNPGASPGSCTGQHANPSGFRQKAEEASALDLQDLT